eukprot:4210468-Prymnesium_polylepis.1
MDGYVPLDRGSSQVLTFQWKPHRGHQHPTGKVAPPTFHGQPITRNDARRHTLSGDCVQSCNRPATRLVG